MELQATTSSSHAVFNIKLHIVFVTKYRREIITSEMLNYLENVFENILKKWRCSMIEFGGESDHVHLLIEIHPALNISTLINNLKTASSRRVRNKYKEHISQFYRKPYFWNRAYYAGSVGNSTLDIVREYVKKQNTKEATPKVR